MNLTDDKKKMEIISRLVKDGSIDFAEAVELLKKDIQDSVIPWVCPNNPIIPLPYNQWPYPFVIPTYPTIIYNIGDYGVSCINIPDFSTIQNISFGLLDAPITQTENISSEYCNSVSCLN